MATSCGAPRSCQALADAALPPALALGLCEAGGGWRAGLCDMTAQPGGCSRCLAVHLVWCWPAAVIAQRTGGSAVLDGLLAGCVCCCLTTPFCFYAPFWAETRGRLRAAHGIPGSLSEDCAVACLLPPCALMCPPRSPAARPQLRP
jgi:Cys-rich protein (TIGR01571 family)